MQPATQATNSDTLISLMRGELSAVETYERALAQIDGSPGGTQLRQLHNDHTQAVSLLRDLLLRHRIEVPTSSGPWGSFANAVQATANLLGDAVALKSLKEGEEHGIKSYKSALEDPEVAEEVKGVARALLARCEGHLPVLDALIARQ